MDTFQQQLETRLYSPRVRHGRIQYLAGFDLVNHGVGVSGQLEWRES